MAELRARSYAGGVLVAIKDALGNGQYAQGVYTPGTVTATVTSVPSDTNTVTLKAANANRRRLILYNDSTAVLYVKLGTGASATDFSFPLPANTLYEFPQPEPYTGIVDRKST